MSCLSAVALQPSQAFSTPNFIFASTLEADLNGERMSDDEFDNIPDDFADVQDVDWAHLLAGPSLSSYTRLARPSGSRAQADPETHSTPPRSISLRSSSSYFSDGDVLDASFLAELDRVEQRIVAAPHVASSHLQNSGKVVSSPDLMKLVQ